MKKPIAIAVGLIALSGPACLQAAKAPEKGGYVSREEYEKLKQDFEQMKALMKEMEKRLAQQPARGATHDEVAEVREELKTVKREAATAKQQAKALIPGMRKFVLTGYGFAASRIPSAPTRRSMPASIRSFYGESTTGSSSRVKWS